MEQKMLSSPGFCEVVFNKFQKYHVYSQKEYINRTTIVSLQHMNYLKSAFIICQSFKNHQSIKCQEAHNCKY